MELKVSVDGVQRIVCGVTDKTTCQEVVIALAQALGRTGCYTLKERFKDFERNVMPGEQLLESLAKYGQHTREVHLTLLHNGPTMGGRGVDTPRRGSQQTCAPLRTGDIGGRGRRGSSSCASHRQSLPPLSRLRLCSEPPQPAEPKTKRKSLTLVEAFGWLENLSWSGKREKEKGKESEKRKGGNSDSPPTASRDCWSPGGVCGIGCQQRTAVTVNQQRRSFLQDDHGSGRLHYRDTNDNHSSETNQNAEARRDQELNAAKTKAGKKPEPQSARRGRVSPPSRSRSPPTLRMEEERLQVLLIHQQARLHELQLQLDSTDTQIRELEGRQAVRLHQEAQGELTDEESEGEELAFWENELRAEEGYEKDLQGQFLDMKVKAAECKSKLEEYKGRLQGMDLSGGRRTHPEALGQGSTLGAQKPIFPSWTKPHVPTLSAGALQGGDHQRAKPSAPNRADSENRSTPTAASHRPHIWVTKGAGKPRERWSRLSDAQNQSSGTTPTSPAVHRSEITIHLSSTRV